MEQLKNLKAVLLILFAVLILVVGKSVIRKGFTGDVRQVIETAGNKNHIISPEELSENKNDFLVVELTGHQNPAVKKFENSFQIGFENLLDEANILKIKESGKKIVLVSEDGIEAAKAWVILTQLNISNVFVLSGEEKGEVLKYKFQPDTNARPEPVSE